MSHRGKEPWSLEGSERERERDTRLIPICHLQGFVLKERSYKGYVLSAARHPRLSALGNSALGLSFLLYSSLTAYHSWNPCVYSDTAKPPFISRSQQVVLLSRVSGTWLNFLNILYWQVSISFTDLNNNTNLLKLPSIYSIL